MSHTDKTRPVWVQVRDAKNRWAMQEEHDHTKGVCSFATWMESKKDYWRFYAGSEWSLYPCHLDYSFYGVNIIKFWPREPRRGRRFNRHRTARTQWRRERQRLLAGMDPDDMEPTPDSRVYDSWMWERWRS